jgi:hypothetical protein
MSIFLHVLSLFVAALLALAPGLSSWFGGVQGAAADGQTVRHTMPWPAGAGGRVFELSNTNGPVRIVAEDRSDVAIVATRTVEREGRAGEPTPQLAFREEAGRLLVCGDDSHCGCHVDWPRNDRRRGDDRARVRVEFDVRVPRAATLDVCAINGGTLRVENAEGSYTLSNVNGDLEMLGIRGSGEARTVNGDLDASFAAAPRQASSFRTVNGRVKVMLPPSLSADLRLKTMNGGLYTDFDTTPLPRTMAAPERRNGRFVYRADPYASVRVGGGGPALTFETLNGDVQVRKQQ